MISFKFLFQELGGGGWKDMHAGQMNSDPESQTVKKLRIIVSHPLTTKVEYSWAGSRCVMVNLAVVNSLFLILYWLWQNL